jgi:23S rRNA pseudouridine1911/1915/1917 synthase
MASAPLEILYEDNHLLVINKPVGLPTQGVIEGLPSVVTAAKAYLKRKYKKPGNVYLGVVSRLDALVGGVLVLARTSKSAARLNEQFRARSARKLYWAVVESPPAPTEGQLTDWVKKDERLQKMIVVPRHSAGAQRATLSYRMLAKANSGTLLEIQLETGRKHQIRLQLANLGAPILGDRKYGSRRTFDGGIALFARCLSIEHPTSSQSLSFKAEPPVAFMPYLPKS